MTDNESNPLLGSWVSDPSEPAIWKRRGRVTLDFFPEGTMRFKSENKQRKSEFKRKYWIEKNMLVLSAPPLHDARTRFKITPEGKLLLYENGRAYPYVRK